MLLDIFQENRFDEKVLRKPFLVVQAVQKVSEPFSIEITYCNLRLYNRFVPQRAEGSRVNECVVSFERMALEIDFY